MQTIMKNWEIQRIKEILSNVLHLSQYDFISASSKDGYKMSMSKEHFLRRVEEELRK